MNRIQPHRESRTVDPGWSTEPGREWLNDAACVGLPLDLFYPDHRDHGGDEPGKAVCRACPVADACLADAVAQPQWGDYGIRGGTTAVERAPMRGPGRRCRRDGERRRRAAT